MEENRDDSKKGAGLSGRKLYFIAGCVFALIFIGCITVITVTSVKRSREKKKLEELAKEAAVTVESDEAKSTLTDLYKEPAFDKDEPKAASLSESINDTDTEETEPKELLTIEDEPVDILKAMNIEIPQKEFDWEKLKETNEDIYAWIYIPDTKIDYPVLQDPKELNYYLDHNVDRTTGYPASIYTQYINKTDFTDRNTVIYGHNMKDGTMFAGLHQYEDVDYIVSHPYIYIYTEDYTYVYEVYASAEFNNKLLPKAYDFDTEEGFLKFIDDVGTFRSSKKNIDTERKLTFEDRIVTLSTCVRGEAEKRYFVIGVLLNPPQ